MKTLKLLVVCLVLVATMALERPATAFTTKAACWNDQCFPTSVAACAQSVRQPVSLRAASRRCRARLTRQCRRWGVLALKVCPEPSDDDGGGDYPDDSPGGALPTTTTTTPRFPTTTTTLPLETGALVGGYQFIGKTDYSSCAGNWIGEGLVIPFTVEAQRGDYLAGRIGTLDYDAIGEVRFTDWVFYAEEWDLARECSATLQVVVQLEELPAATEFTYHYECPARRSFCDVEAAGFIYPGMPER
jgi:hypothetical protein